MKYLRFYKERLPFQPTTSQVIYFDESAISLKMGHPVARFVDSNYEYIKTIFHRAGLEFCFLPRISSRLDVKELYLYFRPEASDAEIQKLREDNQWKLNKGYNLSRYALESSAILNDSRPGLIRYIGKDYDQNDFYIFNYVEFGEPYDGINTRIDGNRYMRQLESYIDLNSEVDSGHHSGNQNEDVEALMTETQRLVNRMRCNGIDEMVIKDIFRPTQMLSRLKVCGSRIFLCDYNNMEIPMGPLPKTVYFLYLHHPEGIAFTEMENHYDELLSIYRTITGRGNEQSIRNSILDLTIPESNSLNEKCSRIRQAFVSKINPELARNYYVTGERGGRRRILLPREMVTFDGHSM